MTPFRLPVARRAAHARLMVHAIDATSAESTAMIRNLPALLVALVLLLAFGARASAAAEKSPEEQLEGQAFSITIFADKNKVVDKLTFTAKTLSCEALGMSKTPYTATKGDAKHKKDINFSAEITGANGAKTKITGVFSVNEVSGTIESTPKGGGAAKTLEFSGAKAGTKK
jgi:hypothetical protein